MGLRRYDLGQHHCCRDSLPSLSVPLLLLLLLLPLLLAAVRTAVASSAAVYDQRQDGKVNVQIDVKDVQIISLVDSDLFDDYTNYDYAYDYADFTIKPRPTSTTTSKPETTSPGSATPTANGNATSSPESSSVEPTPSSTSSSSSSSSSTNRSDPVANSSLSELARKGVSPGDSTSSLLVASELEAVSTGQVASTSPSPTTRDAESLARSRTARTPDSREETSVAPRRHCPPGFHIKSGRCFKSRPLAFISPRLVATGLAPKLLGEALAAQVQTILARRPTLGGTAARTDAA